MSEEIDQLRHEITSLAAETLALQFLFVNLMAGLRSHGISPDLLEKVFSFAADSAEDFAIHIGKKASPAHTVEAVRIIEQLRDQFTH